MNCYQNSAAVKTALGISGTTQDANVLEILKVVSREIDTFCRRFFYSKSATLTMDGTAEDTLLIPDLLSLTGVAVDDDADDVFDDETWAATDWLLSPYDYFPKTMLKAHPGGDYGLAEGVARYQLTGVWGYGDGEGADPWETTSVTATVATAAGTTLTLSAEGVIEAGQTIQVGTEQMFVTAATSDDSCEATVVRGVNGTTAAAHTAAAIATAKYPWMVRRCALHLAVETYEALGKDGISYEMVGEYAVRRRDHLGEMMRRFVGGFKNIGI